MEKRRPAQRPSKYNKQLGRFGRCEVNCIVCVTGRPRRGSDGRAFPVQFRPRRRSVGRRGPRVASRLQRVGRSVESDPLNRRFGRVGLRGVVRSQRHRGTPAAWPELGGPGYAAQSQRRRAQGAQGGLLPSSGATNHRWVGRSALSEGVLSVSVCRRGSVGRAVPGVAGPRRALGAGRSVGALRPKIADSREVGSVGR